MTDLGLNRVPKILLLNVMKYSQDMFIERGFTVKESKECGAGGSMVVH